VFRPEVLLVPVARPSSRLGAELNYGQTAVILDMLFGFPDYDVVNPVTLRPIMTGYGFYGQLDVGRLSCGAITARRCHWIASVQQRVQVGGYFQLTDVSFDDFGVRVL